MPPPPPKDGAAKEEKYMHPNSRNRSRSPRRSHGAERARTPPRSHSRSSERSEKKPGGSRNVSHHYVEKIPVDARNRLNEIKAAKDAVYFGPPCFADNIRHLALPIGFSKVNSTYRKYDGSTAPDQRLADYHMVVQINNGNNLEAV